MFEGFLVKSYLRRKGVLIFSNILLIYELVKR